MKQYFVPEVDSDSKPLLIRDLNPEEKPREKALANGMDSLTDVELLALLLGTGVQGKSVLDLSREILRDNDNKLRRLSRMSVAELKKKYKGIGTAKAILLVAAMTFGARVQQSLLDTDDAITSSETVYNVMRGKLERLNYEEFWVLFVNRANRLIASERVSKGGISFAAVDPRLIVKAAIDHLASGVMLVHNHPSGQLRPSIEDDNLTKRISEMMKIVDVRVLDHLIISPTGYYSYADNGRI